MAFVSRISSCNHELYLIRYSNDSALGFAIIHILNDSDLQVMIQV